MTIRHVVARLRMRTTERHMLAAIRGNYAVRRRPRVDASSCNPDTHTRCRGFRARLDSGRAGVRVLTEALGTHS